MAKTKSTAAEPRKKAAPKKAAPKKAAPKKAAPKKAAPKKAAPKKAAPKKAAPKKAAPKKAAPKKAAPKKKAAPPKRASNAKASVAYTKLTAAAKAAAPLAAAGKHADVVEALRPFIQALPDDPPKRGSGDVGVAAAFGILGQALEGLGQKAVAAAAFEAAAAWSPGQAAADALVRLAGGARKRKR